MTETLKTTAGARTQILPIEKVFVGEVAYGLIRGADKFIVADNECIHSLHDNSETVRLRSGWSNKAIATPAYQSKTLHELRDNAQPMDLVDLAEWVHYWGIKDRMAYNYRLLRKSMNEIGVSDENMPAFGAR